MITLNKIMFSLPTPNGGWYRSPKGVRSRDNLTRRVNRPRREPVKEKEKMHNFGQNAPAQNDLICSQNGQNCTHTRVCALNVALPDPFGVRYQPPKGLVYEPGSRRLTVRYEKKKLPLTNPFGVRYEHPDGVFIYV